MSFDHIHVDISEVDLQPRLEPLLQKAAAWHHHLCPRQVLGVRIGLAGAAALGFEVPRNDKKMVVFVETDGCFISGVQAATGLSVNRRTLRIIDLGRIGVTFVNVKSEKAVRVAPQLDVREKVWRYVGKDQRRRYFAMLEGYQKMPDRELLHIEKVRLSSTLREILSRPGVRVNCQQCGEEIINEREVMIDGQVLCRACAGQGYYQIINRQ
ncbi:MAG: FmdE family protein [Ardenticatenaceae bacterium]|nr:FmdE family protein [Ardenticatenaceae bacterium]